MAAPLLSLKDISLGFGGNPLFDSVELYVNEKDRICLVGRNGSGKTTLLKVMAENIAPDKGEIFLKPLCRTAYLPQEPDLSSFSTIEEYVSCGIDKKVPNEPHVVSMIIEELGLDGNSGTNGLSGGEMKKAALARIFSCNADILFLDEPTNHLDLPYIEWLENRINQFKGAVITVSHDRRFLMNTTTSTFWLDRGKINCNNKGFEGFERWSEEILEKEKKEHYRLNKQIEREQHWLRYGVTARRKRNQGRLRKLQDLRKERAEYISPEGRAKIKSSDVKISGKMIIEAENISKTYDERTIISDFSSLVIRGNSIGIIGPNGAGKTTLLKILTKEIESDTGYVRHGANLEIAYLDQTRQTLKPEETIKETLCSKGSSVEVNGKYRHVISYMKDFMFKPEQANTPVKALSGGERNRLLLAKILAKSSNLLVLDEPTNDLDIETLDVLQDMLSEYSGTVILVSHDRDFLDRIVTSTVHVNGKGGVTEYAGGYSDFLIQYKNSAKTSKKTSKKTKNYKTPVKHKEKKQTKLSYKHQRALEELPKQIKELENRKKEIESQLTDSSLYSKSPEKFSKLSEELEKAKTAIQTLEDEWLEIEMLKEELSS